MKLPLCHCIGIATAKSKARASARESQPAAAEISNSKRQAPNKTQIANAPSIPMHKTWQDEKFQAPNRSQIQKDKCSISLLERRSEERRVGKECRSRGE